MIASCETMQVRSWSKLDENGLSPYQRLDELDKAEIGWLIDEFKRYVSQKTTLMPRRRAPLVMPPKKPIVAEVSQKRPANLSAQTGKRPGNLGTVNYDIDTELAWLRQHGPITSRQAAVHWGLDVDIAMHRLRALVKDGYMTVVDKQSKAYIYAVIENPTSAVKRVSMQELSIKVKIHNYLKTNGPKSNAQIAMDFNMKPTNVAAQTSAMCKRGDLLIVDSKPVNGGTAYVYDIERAQVAR